MPGPQIPLYLLGARMRDNYGFVPLNDGLCLGIVLFSYAGLLCWGFTCDWDLLPDLHDFVVDIEESFKDLQHAADSGEVPEPVGSSERSRAKAKRARATKSAIASS